MVVPADWGSERRNAFTLHGGGGFTVENEHGKYLRGVPLTRNLNHGPKTYRELHSNDMPTT